MTIFKVQRYISYDGGKMWDKCDKVRYYQYNPMHSGWVVPDTIDPNRPHLRFKTVVQEYLPFGPEIVV